MGYAYADEVRYFFLPMAHAHVCTLSLSHTRAYTHLKMLWTAAVRELLVTTRLPSLPCTTVFWQFLQRGHWVVICDVKDPVDAVETLRKKHEGGIGRIEGIQCDVSDAASVEKLAQFAKDKIGTVHYWINNAGINGGRRPFTTLQPSTVEAVVKVNLVGVLLCTKVAMDLMQNQKGVTSHIFNTVGSGVKGGGTPGYATYGATKRGLPQLTDSLVAELEKGVPGFEVEKPAERSTCTRSRRAWSSPICCLNDSTPELRKFPSASSPLSRPKWPPIWCRRSCPRRATARKWSSSRPVSHSRQHPSLPACTSRMDHDGRSHLPLALSPSLALCALALSLL